MDLVPQSSNITSAGHEIDAHIGQVRRHAYRIARRQGAGVEDAENLAQDVALRWWRFGDRDRLATTAWIHLVLCQCREAQRSKMRSLVSWSEEFEINREPPEPEARPGVEQLLQRLPPRQQHFLKLHYLCRVPFEEIARLEGTTPRAARHLCARALEQLRRWGKS